MDDETLQVLESVGLVTVVDGVPRPGSQFETLMPVLRALDAEAPGNTEGQPSDSVGDDPPSRWTGDEGDPTGAELVGLVAHDLRGPLSQASGWLGLARADGDAEYFDAVEAAHERIGERIEDLVLLASDDRTPTNVEHVSVGEAAERVWTDLVSEAVAEKGTLVVEEDREVAAVPDRLERLLANLLRNALVHGSPSTDGGTQRSEQPEQAAAPPETNGGAPTTLTVRVGRLPDGFYVEDDGVGISPSARDRIFEAGYSTAGGGSGLGLASVKQVATAHGWTVTVTEGSDGGARFEFTGAVPSA